MAKWHRSGPLCKSTSSPPPRLPLRPAACWCCSGRWGIGWRCRQRRGKRPRRRARVIRASRKGMRICPKGLVEFGITLGSWVPKANPGHQLKTKRLRQSSLRSQNARGNGACAALPQCALVCKSTQSNLCLRRPPPTQRIESAVVLGVY